MRERVAGGVTSSPGEGAGLSSLSGLGLSVVTRMGRLPILAHLAGARSKDKMGMGLVVGSANATKAMPMDWSTSVAQSNDINWRVSPSFAARFAVFTSFATSLFTSLGLPFLFSVLSSVSCWTTVIAPVVAAVLEPVEVVITSDRIGTGIGIDAGAGAEDGAGADVSGSKAVIRFEFGV